MHNIAEAFDSETNPEFVCFLRYLKRSYTVTVHGSEFKVQSSTVKVVKVFDFESNAEFIRALKLAERACTEIKSKNMKNCKP